MSSEPRKEPLEPGWSPSQRRGLLVLLTLLLAFLIFQAVRDRTFISDPQPAQGPRAAELQSRIDPNSADWQTLSAIPNLGPKRAHAIVAYRDSARGPDTRQVVFQRPADLLHVRGIGPAMVENLRPYLLFPPDAAQTRN